VQRLLLCNITDRPCVWKLYHGHSYEYNDISSLCAVDLVCCFMVFYLQGSGVKFTVDDRGNKAGFIKIRTEDVMVQMTSSVANEKCNAELLDFLAQSLALRRSNLAVRPPPSGIPPH
jgi:hypothetical protein